MSIEGNKDIGTKGTQQIEDTGVTRLPADSSKGRLLRFLFCPPRLGSVPPAWVATEFAGLKVFNRFAARLANSPPNLVTRLGITRANAYYAAGCPLELCDHAAARDLWRVIYRDAIEGEADAPCGGPPSERKG